MDDVRDTLCRWAVQLVTLANWGWELWGISLCAPMIRDMLGLGSELLPAQLIPMVIGAMMVLASVFYWRLLRMRKWAGWVKVVAAGAHVARTLTASEVGLGHWTSQLTLASGVVLLAALILRPRVWSGGF